METDSKKLLYGLEETPPLLTLIAVGLQHVLTTFGINITVPLLIGAAIGFDAQQIAVLVSATLLTSGITTFLQARFGVRLPIIQGSSFAFIGPYLGIFAVVGSQGPQVTMQHIAGAVFLGSFFEMIVGFSGLPGLLQRFVSPVVTGSIVMLVGFSMFKSGAPQAGENWLLSGVTIVSAFVFSLVIGRKNKYVAMLSILLAISAGYLVALVTGQVNFESVRTAQWFRTNLIFPWGLPKFDLGLTLVALAAYLSVITEAYGDYHALTIATQAPVLTDKQINRGIGFEGFGSFLATIWGGFADTAFTTCVGLISLTRVASRKIMYVAAVFLIILGLFGKLGGVVATIPRPVVGGLFCILFGLIGALGLSSLARADLSSMRNVMIIGFIIYMGLSVPAYFEKAEVVITWAPWLAQFIKTIGSTGIAVTAILGLLLDNIIPGTAEMRGLPKREEKDMEEKLEISLSQA